jgi:murein DD-endopeptidase MepM/ murein hydrolase activator NlpD
MVRSALLALPLLLVAQCEPACEPQAPPPPIPVELPALGSGSTPYQLPVADVGAASWGTTHAEYPAADVFVRCGATLVSPVNGVVLEARRVNAYDWAVDNPATRGGRSVAIVGDDGVRYYLAHFESIDDGIERGVRVAAGQRLGVMGRTGRASACHVHVGISPPCPDKEWLVRRGAIWPAPYLDDWRRGGQRSPVGEIEQWIATNPTACADAMADPYAADS